MSESYDQFFTLPQVAESCVENLLKHYSWNDFDLIVEPSAGEGSFYNLIPSNKVGVEIDPELCKDRSDYRCQSFQSYLNVDSDARKVLVLGNPPFGRQNKLSVDFFNHAARNVLGVKVIAFIIPKTWKKDSVQNRLALNFHLVADYDVPSESFYGQKDTSVKCCFQIWEKRDDLRKKQKLPKVHNDWMFLDYVKKDGDLAPPSGADFVVLAYGANSGRTSNDLMKWRPKSVHFIKSNIGVEKLRARFDSLEYVTSDNSARQTSLGRAELVSIYAAKHGS